MRIFFIYKANFNNNKDEFGVYWKALIILKEIKKTSGKFLCVWAKTQLRFEIYERIFKFTYKILNGKLIFYLFSLPSSRTFVILYTSGTSQILGGWFGGSSPEWGVGGSVGYVNPWNLGMFAHKLNSIQMGKQFPESGQNKNVD